MKKFLSLLPASLLFIAVANAQTSRRTNVKDAHDKYANQETTDMLIKAKNKRPGNTGKPATQIADNTGKALPIRKEPNTHDSSIFRKRKVL